MDRLSKLYFGTNTKMYKTIADTVDFLSKLQALTDGIDRARMELFVIPSFTALSSATAVIHPGKILLGAQNMGWEIEGPFTGEISPRMLKEVGVSIVEIGHSERRHVLGETDEMENKKVLCTLDNGLSPLLCIGETMEQKQVGIANEVLRIQLKRGLLGVNAQDAAERLMVAYEPVWAIGAGGTPATKEYAQQEHQVIRETLCELFGELFGRQVPVLYGGSVNNENAVELMRIAGDQRPFHRTKRMECGKFRSDYPFGFRGSVGTKITEFLSPFFNLAPP